MSWTCCVWDPCTWDQSALVSILNLIPLSQQVIEEVRLAFVALAGLELVAREPFIHKNECETKGK